MQFRDLNFCGVGSGYTNLLAIKYKFPCKPYIPRFDLVSPFLVHLILRCWGMCTFIFQGTARASFQANQKMKYSALGTLNLKPESDTEGWVVGFAVADQSTGQ